MKVRLRDVAVAAQVSPATVSKVLSGSGSYPVSALTAARVRRAALDLGYVPDASARNLRLRRSGQLGVVLEAVGPSEPDALVGGVPAGHMVRRTFDGAILAGLSGAARDLQVPALVVYPGGAPDIRTYLDGRVDGLLVGCDPLRGHALLGALRGAPLPVVALWTQRPAAGVAAVDVDHALGARLAAEHLLGLGHRHICFYGGGEGSGVEHFARREAGYRDALRAAGAAPRPAVHDGARLVQAVRDGVTAVFAETDLGAAAAFAALRAAGLQVPADVSLVGFDDIQGAEYIAGGLSTVYQPAEEMAAAGVLALLDLLDGGVPGLRLVPPRLIVRRTTAAPRCRPLPV